jgi:AraC family transcriptional regulator
MNANGHRWTKSENAMNETTRIKGMVCRRCIAAVKDIFMDQGFSVSHVDLGEVTYTPNRTDASFAAVKHALRAEGFEVLDDRESRIIARVKELVEESLVPADNRTLNLSRLVTEDLLMDYDSVSALFTATEGITLEKYAIARRMEKAKAMLRETKLSLTDIAWQLGYSSIHYFSNQFKKQTGLSPSAYRNPGGVD